MQDHYNLNEISVAGISVGSGAAMSMHLDIGPIAYGLCGRGTVHHIHTLYFQYNCVFFFLSFFFFDFFFCDPFCFSCVCVQWDCTKICVCHKTQCITHTKHVHT